MNKNKKTWKIINTRELIKFSHKIFEMYTNSYKKIGLIDFGGWEGLADYLNCSCYLLTNDGDDIHGIILYWLADYGNKISLVISETPEIGKQYVIPKLVELIQTPGFFVELSDALEYIVTFKNKIQNITDRKVIKLLIPCLEDKHIFSKDDKRRITYPLNKEKNIPSNEGSYLREIKDIGQHRKALYGIPCLNKTFIGDGCNRKCDSTLVRYSGGSIHRFGKKQFLYNPNNPKKSFDVYIDKNPKDTIPIKYKTYSDTVKTIRKLERLYKSYKYSHKRIKQVAMILMVRLKVLKNKKKKSYKLAKKYHDFLSKRTKTPKNKRRKLKFKI